MMTNDVDITVNKQELLDRVNQLNRDAEENIEKYKIYILNKFTKKLNNNILARMARLTYNNEQADKILLNSYLRSKYFNVHYGDADYYHKIDSSFWRLKNDTTLIKKMLECHLNDTIKIPYSMIDNIEKHESRINNLSYLVKDIKC